MQSKDLLETSVQKVVAMVHQGGAWGMGAAIQGLAANSFAEIQGQASLGDHDDTDLQQGLRLRWRKLELTSVTAGTLKSGLPPLCRCI